MLYYFDFILFFLKKDVNLSVIRFEYPLHDLSYNTPVSSYDRVSSLCRYSSVSEARRVFVYLNVWTDTA